MIVIGIGVFTVVAVASSLFINAAEDTSGQEDKLRQG